ncbi:MAG: LysM peptidoglycan-binding domain-containing protein [Anaerolineae bacterium]|nr:LysM peptidoglycan-binding domain-containing protein [Anaerolineae bacterium]MDW8171503.1 LysM domain-containing protein [Anaerolineae bacterium]
MHNTARALSGGLLILSVLACNLGTQANITNQPAPTRTPSGAGGLDFNAPTPSTGPNAGALSVQGCSVVITGQRYRVQRGDSLTAIANRFGVALDDLVAANCIDNPNRIRVGQELIIPDSRSSSADDTNLQTYRQDALGFAFDAPLSWFYTPYSESEGGLVGTYRLEETPSEANRWTPDMVSLAFIPIPAQQARNLDDWVAAALATLRATQSVTLVGQPQAEKIGAFEAIKVATLTNGVPITYYYALINNRNVVFEARGTQTPQLRAVLASLRPISPP